MRRVVRGLGAVVGGGLLLLAAACSDNNPTGGGGGGGGGGGASFTVTVTSGTTPNYSWTVGDAFTVNVARTSDRTTIVWGVATVPAADGITSPVTHGTAPSGTVVTVIPGNTVEDVLTAGVQYTVSVARMDGTFGFTDFTP